MRTIILAALLLAEPLTGTLRDDPIDSYSLGYEFHTNEVAAEAKYKGKRLFISGIVEQVSISGDDAVVDLVGSVSCYVPKPWPKALRRIQPDQRVLVRGTVRGIPIMTLIQVQPCSLVSETGE